MKTKTFKIGEYCKGGIITIEIQGKVISVIGKEWDMSKGTSKGSDQSGAKEFISKTVNITSSNAEREIDFFLCDLTTSYYAGIILDWIKSKVKFKETMFW